VEEEEPTPSISSSLTNSDFGNASTDAKGKITYSVAGPLLGIISSAYNLGAILAVPVVPWVAPEIWTTMVNFSWIMFSMCWSYTSGLLHQW
jgi:hypothetical protein